MLNPLRPRCTRSSRPPKPLATQIVALHIYIFTLSHSLLRRTSIISSNFLLLFLCLPVFSSSPNMLLKADSTLSLLNIHAASDSSLSWSSSSLGSGLSSSPIVRGSPAVGRSRFVVLASKGANSRPLTGVVFEPFEEVKKELLLVPTVPEQSLSRHKYANDCESAINEQINVEYNVSYAYHAMYAYFDRDNVALKGLAKFFKESSLEEREHAEKLMEYQNKRGGKVKLQSILMPHSGFEHPEKGDALHAMELALSLEKLVNEKLLHLHNVAGQNNDPQLADFIESEFLNEQVEAIKKISEYVAQLRRVGKGHGVWHFDQMLLNGGVAAA